MGTAPAYLQTSGVSDSRLRAQVSAPGLRATFRVFERWNVESAVAQALLGDPPRSTYFAWKRGAGPALTADGLTRVSYILGIYEALQRLYSLSRDAADQWVSQANSASLFAGKRPLDFMAAGGLPGMHAVRSYLEMATGGPPTRDSAVVDMRSR